MLGMRNENRRDLWKRVAHYIGISYPCHGSKAFIVAEAQLEENENSHSSAFTSDPDFKELLGLAVIMGCGWKENL